MKVVTVEEEEERQKKWKAVNFKIWIGQIRVRLQ